MECPKDPCDLEFSRRDGVNEDCTSAAYRLFDRQRPMHQIMGGGKAADVIMWKRWRVSVGIIVVATIAWLVFEWSELSFLSISSDVLLVTVVIQFLRANLATLRNRQLKPLPELELSEEMVNSAAASFRVKINYTLLMAHDITIGKDFRLFFKVVVCLWLLSVTGSFFSFFTLAYIGMLYYFEYSFFYSSQSPRNYYVDYDSGLVRCSQAEKVYNCKDLNYSTQYHFKFVCIPTVCNQSLLPQFMDLYRLQPEFLKLHNFRLKECLGLGMRIHNAFERPSEAAGYGFSRFRLHFYPCPQSWLSFFNNSFFSLFGSRTKAL
ncbi:hypothetical protein IFM89_021170 [Coptis chinensis]|uniref:Reticulon-like protein n=1 Tax=Coptis chinensis TaxID=261450 RepID=A0A835HG58_9MAGN|nr:hypothetical protein IFM89_021170 [Coptis chinensis]